MYYCLHGVALHWHSNCFLNKHGENPKKEDPIWHNSINSLVDISLLFDGRKTHSNVSPGWERFTASGSNYHH